MAKIAHKDHESKDHESDAERRSNTLTKVARTAAEANQAAASGDRAAKDAGALGNSVVALLSEQTSHALQTATALGRARNLAEVAQVQSDFIGGSFERMGRLNDRYLALVRDGMTSLPFPSRH